MTIFQPSAFSSRGVRSRTKVGEMYRRYWMPFWCASAPYFSSLIPHPSAKRLARPRDGGFDLFRRGAADVIPAGE